MTPHRNQITDDEEIGSYPYDKDEIDARTLEQEELDEVGMNIVGEDPEDLIENDDDVSNAPKKGGKTRQSDPGSFPEDEDF